MIAYPCGSRAALSEKTADRSISDRLLEKWTTRERMLCQPGPTNSVRPSGVDCQLVGSRGQEADMSSSHGVLSAASMVMLHEALVGGPEAGRNLLGPWQSFFPSVVGIKLE